MDDICVEVITDVKLDELFKGLIKLGFTSSEEVLKESISYVDFICSESFELWVGRNSRKFWTRPLLKKALVGFHINRMST